MPDIDFGVKLGTHDSLLNGEIVKNIPDKMVYVSKQADLSNFADYPDGTFAATYGFKKLWQKKSGGTWETIL